MRQSYQRRKKKAVKHLAKQYFKKNRIRNIAAMLAILLTAFLFSSITSLGFHVVSSMQLSMQMQKGSKADGTFGYLTEEQYEQLAESDFVEQAGHRRVVGYASNVKGHSIEINYADSVQQELTFCEPTHGKAPKAANEIATTDRALKALGVEPKEGAAVPLEFEIRGKSYHYDMILSGWWEAGNDMISVAIVSEPFVEENPEVFQNTYREDREMAGVTYSDVVLKDKNNIQKQMDDFVRSIGGNSEDMSAANFILAAENRVSQGLTSPESILFAVVFVLMFVVCGYLLIYNIFDISVMQDVRQYGLLRTIGVSSKQIRSLVRYQAVWLTAIALPVGLILGFFAGWMMLPTVMEIVSLDRRVSGIQVSTSPLIFVIAALFTILTVCISIRKPARKAATVSPLEAVRYTEHSTYKKRTTRRGRGVKLSHMAFSNLGRNKRRSAFIMLSMLLCIVLFNSVIVITQSMDEEKAISRNTKTDFTVYNSIAFNVEKGFHYRSDGVPQAVIDRISQQPGVENERYLYRNTSDDTNVQVDYGFEGLELTRNEYGDLKCEGENGYPLAMQADEEGRCYGNVMGASENFWEDMTIFEGEKDPQVLKQKMLTGDYVIVGCDIDKLTGDPRHTRLTDALQVGDSISFYKDGKIAKTCTILARATLVGTESETPSTTTAQGQIGGDAPFVFLPDTAFKELYEVPTLLSYGFNVEESLQPQMEEMLSSYVEQDASAAYTSTKLLKEQVASIRSMVLVVGSLIGGIMAFAGLINFTNMLITSIITRRHEFATLQSIGMTKRQLRRLVVCEGVCYAAGADVIGILTAAALAMTVLKNMLNSPSMWFFSLHVTLTPAVMISVLYLILASVIPLLVLHFFNNGTVVERLRITE
ncbi:MAG: ABC transporter permease [Lachnospiraceae bacterium]